MASAGKRRRRKQWRTLREELGDCQDRRRILSFFRSVTGYEPNAKQQRAHVAQAAHKGVIHKGYFGGVGAGKTYFGASESTMLAICNPGVNGAILAPTYAQVEEVLMPAVKLFTDRMAEAGYPLVKKWVPSKYKAHLVCGGVILFKSFDNVKGLVGFDLGWFWQDESEQASRPEEVHKVLIERLRNADARIAQGTVTTTPHGHRGVVGKFADIRQRAKDDGDLTALREWWATIVTTYDNEKNLPSHYLPSLKAGLSKRQFEESVLARILKPQYAVYPEFDRQLHLVPWEFNPALPYDISIDWGNKPHALWWQPHPSRKGASVCFAEFCEDVSYKRLQAEIKRRAKVLGAPRNASCDKAGVGEVTWFAEAFPRTTVRTIQDPLRAQVRVGVEVVRAKLDPVDGSPFLLFGDHLLESPSDRGIIRCLEQYEKKRLASGAVSDDPRKDGRTDHGADSLRYHTVCVLDEGFQPFEAVRGQGNSTNWDVWDRRAA